MSNAARLADDHARAVVDEQVRADGRARMDVDARPAVRPLGQNGDSIENGTNAKIQIVTLKNGE
jgi:hypothetical protein